ncbi:MAG: hypothetical protein WCT06_05805 [Armatimonadota bacterium]|jgi:hypothetical protein
MKKCQQIKKMLPRQFLHRFNPDFAGAVVLAAAAVIILGGPEATE